MSLLPVLLLAGCWSRSPGPVALADAQAPVDIVEERVPSRATTWSLSIRAGSAYDPPGQEGLAWLTAHAAAQGGAGGRSAAEIQRELYVLGGRLQVEVGHELVTWTLQCDQEQATACGELLAGLVTAPSLDAAALSHARAQARAVLEDLVRGPARPLAEAALDRSVFEGHPYGHAAIGRLGALDTLDVVDLQRFHAQRYLRPAATLGLVGEPDMEGVVDVQVALAVLPPRLVEEPTPRALPRVQGRVLRVIEAPVQETWVLLGHGTELAPGHPDRLAVEAGLAILADGPDSRLGRALRVGDGAAVRAEAHLGRDDLRVQPAVRVALRPAGVDAALPTLAAALRELERLVADGPTVEELAHWQRVQAGRDSAAAATPRDRVEAAAAAHLLGGPTLWQRAAAAAALDPSQVAAALAAHLHPEDLHIVVVTGDATPLRALAVEGTAPSAVDGVEPAPAADYGVGIGALSVLSSSELLR